MANGMRVDKCGCVEVYCASDFLQSRGLWGVGGVILHELCHAFHDQHCSKGFENPIIRQAYTDAMRCKTYDSVQVHGEQGLHGPVKAYACTNCMEFLLNHLWLFTGVEMTSLSIINGFLLTGLN